MRCEPVPVFPKAAPSIHRFTTTSASTAVETFRLPSGELLRLEHGGCEYYVLTLQFSAPVKQTAYVSAARLLDTLIPLQPDSRFDLALAANTLREMASKNAPLNTESPVPGDGEDFLQARLKLERAKGKLQLTLFRGPL